MKTILSLAASAAAFIAIPGVALAQETAHPYVGVQVGFHDLGVDEDPFPTLDIDDNGMIYGAYAGVDYDIGGSAVFGVEGNFNLGTGAIDYEFGAAARVGFRIANGTIIFARGGYQWVNVDAEKLTGVPNLPAGLEDTAEDYLIGVGADIATGSGARFRVALDTIAFDSLRPTVGVNFVF